MKKLNQGNGKEWDRGEGEQSGPFVVVALSRNLSEKHQNRGGGGRAPQADRHLCLREERAQSPGERGARVVSEGREENMQLWTRQDPGLMGRESYGKAFEFYSNSHVEGMEGFLQRKDNM